MNTYHKIKTLFKRDPSDMSKLLEDQFSCQEFEFLKDNTWSFTEKLHGTNLRVIYNGDPDYAGDRIVFKGKTDKAEMYPGMFETLEYMFLSQVEKFMETFDNRQVCYYLEGIGKGIQKGGENYSKDKDAVLFDVKINDWWLKRDDVEQIASLFQCKVAPVIMEGTLDQMVQLVKTGFNSQWGDFMAEGVVARPKIELKDRSGQRIITKLKHRDFRKG